MRQGARLVLRPRDVLPGDLAGERDQDVLELDVLGGRRRWRSGSGGRGGRGGRGRRPGRRSGTGTGGGALGDRQKKSQGHRGHRGGAVGSHRHLRVDSIRACTIRRWLPSSSRSSSRARDGSPSRRRPHRSGPRTLPRRSVLPSTFPNPPHPRSDRARSILSVAPAPLFSRSSCLGRPPSPAGTTSSR